MKPRKLERVGEEPSQTDGELCIIGQAEKNFEEKMVSNGVIPPRKYSKEETFIPEIDDYSCGSYLSFSACDKDHNVIDIEGASMIDWLSCPYDMADQLEETAKWLRTAAKDKRVRYFMAHL